jgi:2-hydroxychromene-2-carboxylate isomerase
VEKPSHPRITFYFDFISPYAYIGSVAIERLAARLDREVEWRPVLIGVTILKVMGMRPLPEYPLKGPYLSRDRERLAEWFGVPLRHHGLKGHNSLLASRAFLHLTAEEGTLAKRFAQAIFTRLWVDGRDITPISAVLEVAKSVGADVASLETKLDSDESKEALRSAVALAIHEGVFGVPTFMADGEMFWGNDHLWMLDHWICHHTFQPLPAKK